MHSYEANGTVGTLGLDRKKDSPAGVYFENELGSTVLGTASYNMCTYLSFTASLALSERPAQKYDHAFDALHSALWHFGLCTAGPIVSRLTKKTVSFASKRL